MQKSCVAVTQPIVPRTKPNKPCDGNRLGTRPPYNFSTLGVHPLHTSVLGIWLTKTLQLRYFGCAPPPYFGSRIIVP